MGIREGVFFSGVQRTNNGNTFRGKWAWDTTSDSLSAMLSQHGTVVSCDTGTVRNGRTRGWAIVQMGSPQDAQNVIANCDNADLDGRNLNVRLDQKQDEGARAPRGGGGGKGERPRRGGDPSLEGKAENSSGLQVVVRNLPWSVPNEMLRGTFEQIGTVTDAQVICHADSGRSKGWGTVRFAAPEET